MDPQILAPAAAAATSVGVTVFFLGAARAARLFRLGQRMDSFVVLAQPETLVATPEPVASAALAAGLNRRLTRSSLGEALQGRLTRAGVTLKPSEFMLMQVASACVAALLTWVFTGRLDSGIRLLAILLVGAGGGALPLVILSVREGARVRAFERQLPQAIEAMAGTLQAGSTLPQAMETISRELLPPLSVELRRILREMELGLALTDALANLVRRMPSADLLLLNSAIGIQNQVGGDLAEILRSISHTIRERLRIRNEINVLTAQGRYSTYIITGLPIALFFFLYFTRYDYMSQLLLPGITRVLLVGGITGVVVGFYAMKKIVTVDV